MQPQHPVESPPCFIKQIRNPIGAGLPQRIHPIPKHRLRLSVTPLPQLIRQQHLRGCIARCEQILQLITRIVPAAASIDVASRRHRPINRPPVERMAHRIDKRVVPTPLLPHELQKLVWQVSIDGRTDTKLRRLRIAEPYKILPHGRELGKVQGRVMVELAPFPFVGARLPFKDHLLRCRIHNLKLRRQRPASHRNGNLRILWPIP